MKSTAARFGGGFLALAAIWIGVYWLWEPSRSAGISFPDDNTSADSGAVREPVVQLRTVQAEPDRLDVGDGEELLEPSRVEEERVEAGHEIVDNGVPPVFREYAIQPGDTFERISKRFYGTIRYAGAIAAANPFVSPTTLRPGQTIRVPVDPKNVQGRPAEGVEQPLPTPAYIEYVVVQGDTLSEIAQRFYGSLRYADVIFQANRETMQSMDDLSIGDTLRIPSRESVLGKSKEQE